MDETLAALLARGVHPLLAREALATTRLAHDQDETVSMDQTQAADTTRSQAVERAENGGKNVRD